MAGRNGLLVVGDLYFAPIPVIAVQSGGFPATPRRGSPIYIHVTLPAPNALHFRCSPVHVEPIIVITTILDVTRGMGCFGNAGSLAVIQKVAREALGAPACVVLGAVVNPNAFLGRV